MKNLTGRCSRAAVEISVHDIKKQPSPVMVTVCLCGWARCAPSAAGIDQPIAWLFVGLKKVLGAVVVNVSHARYCDRVTSTKVSASGQVSRRSVCTNFIGSTQSRA